VVSAGTSQRARLTRDASWVLFANSLNLLVLTIVGIVVPRMMTPTQYGIWRSLDLIRRYAVYVNLGVSNAMGKTIPYLRGSGGSDGISGIRSNAFWVSTFLAGIVSVAILGASFVFPRESGGFYRYGLMTSAVTVLGVQWFQFYVFELRANKRFSLLSCARIALALASAALWIILLRILGPLGLLIGTACAYLGVVALLVSFSPVPSPVGITWRGAKTLIRTGLPLALIPIAYMVMTGIDQVMILVFLSKADLGFYGIAMTISAFLYFLPEAIGQTVFPSLLERFGETHRVSALEKLLDEPTKIISYVLPVLIGGVFLLVHLPIRHYLVEYTPSLNAIYIIIFGMHGMSLIMISQNFLIAIGKTRTILRMLLIAIGLSVGLNYVALRLQFGVAGVATATALTYIAYSASILLVTYKHFFATRLGVFRKVLFLYLPIFYSGAMIAITTNILHVSPSAALSEDLRTSALQVGMFLVLCAPLFYLATKTVGISTILHRGSMRGH